ncbi:related to 20beta-hydroxysteroid dehydrogenase [Phialocephala subalpina]|uniref:Related to 20beta-hydroxysteroid dehydrogenase n=1 Tax=Phialocephala subalpina TaxID=576137 RepID=A0A1L7WH09_9HELO|nr:related to 20beta-hydroxysteroid dehydrogenase [Phialocephala subalpina]
MSSNPVFKQGNTAVITGGASGIGLALATKLASYGMNVVIVDNNSSNLAEAKKSVKGKVEMVEMDVSKVGDFERLKSKVEKDFGGKIDLLVLNAGIGLKGSWDDSSYFHKIMDVNLFGVIHGLNTLLPLVTKNSSDSSPSSIIITGSKQGITNPPGNPAYNASKAAIKTLTEHLSYDLSKTSPSTSVHLLVPGWTFTGLSGNQPFATGENKKEKPAGAWSPEQVVGYLEKKMGEGKFYVICPDNDVTEELDRKRMLWDREDLVKGRPPLSRWREEFKEEHVEWIEKTKI